MSVVFEALQMMEGERPEFDAAQLSRRIERSRRSEHQAPLNWQTVLKSLRDEGELPVAALKPRLRPVDAPKPVSVPTLVSTPVLSAPLPVSASKPAGAAKPVGVPLSMGGPAATNEVQFGLQLLEEAAGSQQESASSTALDLVPIEHGLVELKTHHGNLCDEVVGQIATLKRTENKLSMVREATERNTLEQKELIESFRGVSKKVNFLAVGVFSLLALSIVVEIALFLNIHVR